MKFMKQFNLLLITMIIFFPGCVRYIDWGQSVVYQGCGTKQCFDQIKPYIKTAHLYDGLTTLGHFNALWLSDFVVKEYNEIHEARFCCSSDSQLPCCEQGISFYILVNTPHDCSYLYEDKSPWSISLMVNGRCYVPDTIKKVCLPPEIKEFFEDHYTKSKTAYVLNFKKVYRSSKFSLVFKRIDRAVWLSWYVGVNGCVFDPCCPISQELAYDIPCRECSNC